jgi:hypothetical protein
MQPEGVFEAKLFAQGGWPLRAPCGGAEEVLGKVPRFFGPSAIAKRALSRASVRLLVARTNGILTMLEARLGIKRTDAINSQGPTFQTVLETVYSEGRKPHDPRVRRLVMDGQVRGRQRNSSRGTLWLLVLITLHGRQPRPERTISRNKQGPCSAWRPSANGNRART